MTIDPAKYGKYKTAVPVRHRRKVPFTPKIRLRPGVEERLSRISGYDRELADLIVPPADFEERIQRVVASNLFSSVRLEGSPLAFDEVRSIARNSLAGRVRLPQSPPRREILNHLGVWLLPDVLGTRWTLATISALHNELLRAVDPSASPGRLRTREGAIYSDHGQELFITCPPQHIREELESLLTWLAEDAAALHPVVAGAVFSHEFESIHPFAEGNGRCGRVLLHAYLQNHGLPTAYRVEMEAETLRFPETYYRVLSWTDAETDYSVLLEFFSETIESAYLEAMGWFREHDVLRTLDPVSRLLLARAARETGPFSLNTAHTWLPSHSDQTIRMHLSRLRLAGLIHAEGRTRGLRYRFADPYADLRKRLVPLREQLARPATGMSHRRRSTIGRVIAKPKPSESEAADTRERGRRRHATARR